MKANHAPAPSRMSIRPSRLASLRVAALVASVATSSACRGQNHAERVTAAPESESKAAASVASAPRSPAPPPDPLLPGQRQADFIVKDFRFASGETVAELRMHYTTLGSPHRDAQGVVDNAILLLHGTTGRAKAFLADAFRHPMLDAGGPFDTSKFFVILPDDVGHGASSKPSDGLHGRFPHYGYRDMVELQHRLVVEGLALTHLHVVAGTSMGGMHTWMWTETYPDFMDAAIPVASTPTALAGRNLLWRRLIIEGTRTDPAYAEGEYTKPPHGYLATIPLFYLMIDGTAHLAEIAPNVQTATGLLSGWAGNGRPIPDANDAVYALDASRDYDPEPQVERITAPVLAVNFADDEIVAPSLPAAEPIFKRIRSAKEVVVPASASTRGHSTLGLAAQWSREVTDFLGRLTPRTRAAAR